MQYDVFVMHAELIAVLQYCSDAMCWARLFDIVRGQIVCCSVLQCAAVSCSVQQCIGQRRAGRGQRPRKPNPNFVPLLKKDQNNKSHWRLTQASVTALLVPGFRITDTRFSCKWRAVPILYLYKSNQKLGSKLKK